MSEYKKYPWIVNTTKKELEILNDLENANIKLSEIVKKHGKYAYCLVHKMELKHLIIISKDKTISITDLGIFVLSLAKYKL